MSTGLAFWILMLLWLVFGIVIRNNPNPRVMWGGHGLFLFILLALVGWKCFGPALHN